MAGDPIFLDTSGWLALLNSDEQLHEAAVRIWRGEVVLRRRIVVLTDWIVAETGNGLARTPRRTAFAEAVRSLPGNPGFRWVPIDGDLLARAVDLYGPRPDKSWGLFDCASFVVMSDLGIRDALTCDRHFDQAGFRSLLPGS